MLNRLRRITTYLRGKRTRRSPAGVAAPGMSGRLWIAAALAALLISGGVWQFVRGRSPGILPVDPRSYMKDDDWLLRLNHVQFHGISNGKIVWEVYADHVDLSKDQLIYTVGGLKKMALLQNGVQELTVNADGLQQNVITGDINIYGAVTVMGKDITLSTPGVIWQDRLQALLVPQRLSGQFGDIAVVADKGARYSVKDGHLQSQGTLMVSCGGNVMNAGGIRLDVRGQAFTLAGPIHVKYLLDDVEAWAEGKRVPKIPDIPDAIKERYRDYCRKNGLAF